MKAKDLPYPFVQETENCVVVGDRIWAIPDTVKEDAPFAFQGWSSTAFFGNNNPVHVEYCSGNGAWIAARAQGDPSINWVGVEIKFGRVRKIWSKIKNNLLHNLIVLFGEGLQATKHYFPSSSVDAVYVNFPDPWPKRRHAKNRIIEPVFIEEVARILKTGGVLTLVTDDEDYSKQMIRVVRENPVLESCFPSPFFVTHYEGYGSSYFESLWREKGKVIRFHQFKKREKPVEKRILLEAGIGASLNWTSALTEAKQAIDEGHKILWELNLGLFEELKLPLDNEAQFNSFTLALDHFSQTVWDFFSEESTGVSLYRGKADFSTRPLALDMIEALAYALPDAIPCFVEIDVKEISDPLLLAKTFCTEHRGRLHFLLEGACLPIGLLNEKKSGIAVCFPSDSLEDAAYIPYRTLFHRLEGEPYRIIPESALTSQWEGLDAIIVSKSGLSAAGKRMLQGFIAAGGQMITFGEEIGILGELSFEEWSRDQVRSGV